MTRAVVFAYHNVGVRCLKTLLAHGVEVPLVLTHADAAHEQIWFDSVANTAADYGIASIAPADPNAAAVVARVAACRPDFLFSFYYRLLLKPALLALAPRGALNVHGSLLPKYRGRVPVNWAIIHGETRTGATLHYMTDRPDDGDIVAQSAVPILPDDTAKEVFDKVTVAAELALHGGLPGLLAGTAPRQAQDPSQATYFGGRKPDDGVIDWSQSAQSIHNLVRAVAPPYPGARTRLRGRPARVLRSRVHDATARPASKPSLTVERGAIVAHCGGGGTLSIVALEVDGVAVTAASLVALCGAMPVALSD
ncbi:MAG TPA: formyltransferase [Casimicrobiaceae bacterium]|nr:formyltransferase [Casimicrobiaceae bacterium]